MIMSQLRSFFSGAPKRQAQELYIALVRQSRNQFFYTDCGVPDTLDGRFEIIVLHVFLALRSLKEEGAQMPQRLLLESLFDDMDRSLREMGVGDMGVAKRVRAMSKAAFGRLEAYTSAFDSEESFKQALLRNVYRGAEGVEQVADRLAAYACKWVMAPSGA